LVNEGDAADQIPSREFSWIDERTFTCPGAGAASLIFVNASSAHVEWQPMLSFAIVP
jgi:hypothetical protein